MDFHVKVEYNVNQPNCGRQTLKTKYLVDWDAKMCLFCKNGFRFQKSVFIMHMRLQHNCKTENLLLVVKYKQAL